MDTNETKQKKVEMLIKYINLGRDKSPLYADRCENAFTNPLISITPSLSIKL